MKNITIGVVFTVLLSVCSFSYFGDGGPKIYYPKTDFNALLGRAVSTEWRLWGKIKLQSGEYDTFDKFKEASGAKEGSWTFIIRSFENLENLNSLQQYLAKFTPDPLGSFGQGAKGTLYTTLCQVDNYGDGFVYAFIFPQTAVEVQEKAKVSVESYIKEEMSKFDDVSVKIVQDKGAWGIVARMLYTKNPAPDAVQERLEYLMYNSKHLIGLIDPILRIEASKPDASGMISKEGFLNIFPDWAGYDKTQQNSVGGTWTWAYGEGDDKRSLFFDNYGDNLMMSYKIRATTDANQKRVIEELTKWMKENPYRYADSQIIKVYGKEPWLEIVFKYKGHSTEELKRAYQEFEDDYSKRFHDKARQIVRG